MTKIQIIYSLIFLSIGVLGYWIVLPRQWRSIFLFVASFCFMAVFSIKYAVYFVFNAALIYVAGTHISRSDKNSKLLLKLTLVWLIGSLSVFKYTHTVLNSIFGLGSRLSLMPENTFSQIVFPLGLSYIVFRLIHYIVEVYRKTLPEHSFWDFATYVFFFPTFIAGPVERFPKFHAQTEEKKSFDPADINYGLFRIISGIIKKFVIADALAQLIMPVLSSPQESSRMLVILAIYGVAIRIYMDFSGYTDMAIGVARLFGYKIVENFNYPFFKNNIALFWRNWHMSVYSFIRDYFFFPFFGYRASQLKIYFGVFFTMVVFCLWHEGSLSFLLLGVYAGLGLVIWQAFQEIKRKYRRIRAVVDSPYMSPFSTFLTFNVVSLCMIVFYFDNNNIINILQKVFL